MAVELSAQDRLPVHAREELGVDVGALARPGQASTVSAFSFLSGALLPVLVVAVAPASARIVITVLATLVGLVVLGVIGARLGGAPPRRAALRVFIAGVLALTIALVVGRLTGAAV